MRSLSYTRLTLQGNVRVLAVRGVILTVSGALTGGLAALYVKAVLGADAVILGLFSSIWSAIYLLFILIGGWFGDRYDRKKMLLLGTALTLPNPIIYALAPSWHLLLIANFLGALGSAFANPAYTGILFASVKQQERSRTIAIINTLMSLANAVFPPLGAYIIERMGGLNEIRMMFVLQSFFSLGVWLYTLKALEPNHVNKEEEFKGFRDVLRDIVRQMRGVYRLSKERKATPWLYMSLTGPFAWELVGPFWTIYAAEVCGSSLFIIGLLSTVGSLTGILLQVPMASISDRRGRRKTILAVRPFRYMCILSLIACGSYSLPFAAFIPLLAWMLDAVGTSSGPAWSAAQTEVMPDDLQGRWNALLSFLWRVTAVPASLIGGFLWNIDPRLPFIIALAVDGLVRYPILIRHVPETLVPAGRRVPVMGPNVVIYGLTEAGQTSTALLVQRIIKADIIDESLINPRQVGEVLTGKKEPVIVEGKPALFVAKKSEESVVVLLVASKEERARRRAKRSKKPDFVALREVEDEDREVDRLVRRLYRADISKIPPFDVAINTERVPPNKVTKIISILREDNEEKNSES